MGISAWPCGHPSCAEAVEIDPSCPSHITHRQATKLNIQSLESDGLALRCEGALQLGHTLTGKVHGCAQSPVRGANFSLQRGPVLDNGIGKRTLRHEEEGEP
jgi:hypothetical protein